MRKTTDYRNHIKNYEIETREFFEQENSSPESIQRTPPTNIMTRLDDNQLTQSTDSSKQEKTHESEDEGSGSGFTSGSCVYSCFELSVDRVS